MLEMAIKMEKGAIVDYNAWANECAANADSASKKVFEALVDDEETHMDQYETQLDHLGFARVLPLTRYASVQIDTRLDDVTRSDKIVMLVVSRVPREESRTYWLPSGGVLKADHRARYLLIEGIIVRRVICSSWCRTRGTDHNREGQRSKDLLMQADCSS